MILVTGAGGFIGRHVCDAFPASSTRAVSHRDALDPSRFDGVTCVVHTGRSPHLGKPDFDLAEEIELEIAKICARQALPLISLSTRAVYGDIQGPIDEQAPTRPTTRYGKQKLAIENALYERLGDLLTRLRLANIFGFEPERATFFGTMLTRLRDGNEIVFDMSPFVTRDFLPVEQAAQIIAQLARNPPGGVVNVGSGIATSAGALALAVIEGFARGRLVIEDPRVVDQFVFDIDRLRQLTGFSIEPAQIAEAARKAGRALRNKVPG